MSPISPPPKKPSLSVIIPAYNAEPFIKETLDSVLSQPGDVEVVVVNDGSTDKTADIIQAHDQKIIFIDQQNQGESVARNQGIKHATGDIIVFLDADDRMAPNTALKVREAFIQHPDVDLVYGQIRFFGMESKSIERGRDLSDDGSILGATIKGEILLPGQYFLSKNCLHRSTNFRTDIKHGEDWEFLLNVSRHAKCQYIPNVVIEKRVHKNMQSLESNRPDILGQRLSILHDVFGDEYNRVVTPLLTRGVLADWLRTFAFSLAQQGDWKRARPIILRSLIRQPFQPSLWIWLARNLFRV